LIEQPVLNRLESEDKDDTVQTRGAVPATMREVPDRSREGPPSLRHTLFTAPLRGGSVLRLRRENCRSWL